MRLGRQCEMDCLPSPTHVVGSAPRARRLHRRGAERLIERLKLLVQLPDRADRPPAGEPLAEGHNAFQGEGVVYWPGDVQGLLGKLAGGFDLEFHHPNHREVN